MPAEKTKERFHVRQEMMAKRKHLCDHPGGGIIMTKQDQADSTDINLIIQQFKNNGRVPMTNTKVPKYGDFSMANSLTEAYALVEEAEKSFMELPPELREMVGNNAVTFLEAMATEDGAKALLKAGLKVEEPKPPAPTPSPAKTVPAPPVAEAKPVS